SEQALSQVRHAEGTREQEHQSPLFRGRLRSLRIGKSFFEQPERIWPSCSRVFWTEKACLRSLCEDLLPPLGKFARSCFKESGPLLTVLGLARSFSSVLWNLQAA